MTLKDADDEFAKKPCKRTAGAYMDALMEAEAEGDIDDDEWMDGLASIRDYLLK